MSNKKVYLAKNTLASGFDVEYVRSHLSRIPGIIIVESGDSIKPGDCAAFVIVPNEGFNKEEEEKVTLSKNVTQDLEEFFEEYSGHESLEYITFIFTQSKGTDEPGDVEETFPLIVFPYDTEILYKKKEHYDKFGSLSLEGWDEQELLVNISEIIDAPSSAWVSIKRHHIPAPEYAMPAVPSIEERQIKHHTTTQVVGRYFSSISDKRLLLLRR